MSLPLPLCLPPSLLSSLPPALASARPPSLPISRHHPKGSPRAAGGRGKAQPQPGWKTAMETILRVSARANGVERPDIAERLQIAIQQALIR